MAKFKKIVATTLSAVMIMSVMTATGCGKKKAAGKLETVEADSPWYTITTERIGEYDEEEFEYIYCDPIGFIDGKYYVHSQGSKYIPDDFDWETDDYTEYEVDNIDIYDLSGELLQSIDLRYPGDEIEDYDGYYLQSVSVTNQINITYCCYNWTSVDTSDHYYEGSIDLETFEMSEFTPRESGSTFRVPEDASQEQTLVVGDYSIEKYWLWGDESSYSYILNIIRPDGSSQDVDLRDVFPNYSIYDISTIIGISETEALINPSLDGVNETVWFYVDMEAGTVEEYDEDLSWIDDIDLYNMSTVEGLGNVITDSEGIKLIDFDNQEVTELFNFDACNINRGYNLNLLSYSEDEIVFAGSIYRSETGVNYSEETYIITLERADENPNAGKTILKCATLGWVNEALSTAICEFNETSEEYFISIDHRYDINNFYDDEAYNDEDADYTQINLDAQTELSNQLSIDLIAGDGPDIIIDGFGFTQLNNDDYLVDLSEYYASGDFGCFDNVIEAAMTGDKLYQIPLSFSIEAITTDKSNVDNDQIGFTYDEYTDFVDDVCNGSSPIQVGRLDAFTQLVLAMSDTFEEDGSYNFDKDEFVELAEYVRDNIDEEFDWSEVEDAWMYGEAEDARYSYVYSVGNFMNMGTDVNRLRFLGTPSIDGRGPSMNCVNSAAISVETQSPDGCWSFIETLLSEDVQRAFYSEAIPVNIDVYEELTDLAITQVNADYERWYTEAELAEYGIAIIDDDFTSDFEGVIESCSSFLIMDAAVQSILREEIQPFFSGQKDIDEIITIIQDKVNTYINERG